VRMYVLWDLARPANARKHSLIFTCVTTSDIFSSLLTRARFLDRAAQGQYVQNGSLHDLVCVLGLDEWFYSMALDSFYLK
jgi:hypothetical protein